MNTDNEVKYTKCAIVYIDFLGITKTIEEDDSGKSISIMKKAIEEAERYANVDLSPKINHSKPKYKFFSDNIIFAIDLKQQNNDGFLLGIVANFVENIMLKCGWLCRGSFTYGDLYIDDDFVWGPGLVRSYKLENNIAIYPRIIIDPDVIPILTDKYTVAGNSFLQKDDDGIYFLDNISYINNIDDKRTIIKKYRKLCDSIAIKNKGNLKVLQKTDWLLTQIIKLERNISEDEDGQAENGN
jgi:hypothetical protein